MDRLISEKSVMEVIYGCDWFIDEEHAEVIKERIKSISSAEPKTGHWTRELIRNEKGGCIGAKMICSECGNDNRHDEYMNYCPSCGAKMVEPQESEEIETWNGIHAQITAPKGTFERIFNDTDDDNDI